MQTIDSPLFNDQLFRKTIYSIEQPFFNHSYILEINNWMRSNWHLSIYAGLTYVFLTFIGLALMKNRAPFSNLYPFMILWNWLLAFFSLIGFVRVLPEFLDSLMVRGLEYSLCNNSNAYGVTGFWTYMFCMSKMPELLDTMFVLMRKKPLTFLHWFHHCTVLIYTWYSYENLASSGRWFTILNLGVHACMYSYYGLRTMRIKVPRWCSMVITSLQIAQMIIGCFVNYKIWFIKRSGRMCRVTDANIAFSSIVYFTYCLLFVHFFMKTYLRKTGSSAEVQANYWKSNITKNKECRNDSDYLSDDKIRRRKIQTEN